MKNFLRVILGIAIGTAVALGGTALYGKLASTAKISVPDLPDGHAAVITHVAGPVFIIRQEELRDAAPGDVLEAGDIVKVADGAIAQVQLADKGSARLGGDTLVHFRKLTGANRNLELRTEVLAGSLSYRVEKLSDSESIIIEADGTEYEVRGTEFVIETGRTGNNLFVAEGQVEVRRENTRVLVEADQQYIIRDGIAPAQAQALTPENRERMEAAAVLPPMPFGSSESPEPVALEIRTTPPDAVIYIDGLKTGAGHFSALLPRDTSVQVHVRRRGFKDSAFEVDANANTLLDVVLEPAGLEETLAQTPSDANLLERLRADYESRLEELRGQFNRISADSDTLAALQAEVAAERAEREKAVAAVQEESRRLLAETQAQRELEKARGDILETELTDSRAENERLKDLIRQIQDLTDE